MNGVAVTICGVPKKPMPYAKLGAYVRSAREAKRMTATEVATKAGMRNAQMTAVESGANVEVQFYERIAIALGYRGALEMFTSGGDALTVKLLRLWRALPDDEARKDALRSIREQILADAERDAT